MGRLLAVPQAQVVTLKLEGKLLEPWCDALRSAAREAMRRGAGVRLDLIDVSFVDAARADAIRSLIAQGLTLDRCSSFVAELLNEQPERV